MEGSILGYNPTSNEGTIKGQDGNRYAFSNTDWKSPGMPAAGQSVDFEVTENTARNIYLSAGAVVSAQNNNQMLAVVALLLTLFFGVIGTLVSRLGLARQSFGIVWLPALMHFLSFFLLIIPVLGWLAWFGINIYFSVVNYKLVANGPSTASKYA